MKDWERWKRQEDEEKHVSNYWMTLRKREDQEKFKEEGLHRTV